MNKIVVILVCLLPALSWALPIDWHGKFGVDSTVIEQYRFIENGTIAPTDGSMDADPASGAHDTSSVQSYVFSLQPEMIINDAATFKAEITTGYGKGGILGRDTTTNQAETDPLGPHGNALFLNSESSGSDQLSMAQFYLELYSDLATYKVGRHSKQWGLGAVYSSGNNLWDRHTFAYDGVTMDFKLNNFKISPFWARVNSGQLTRLNHTKEYGVSFLYDNVERDVSLGVLYAKKQNGSNATAYTAVDGTGTLGTNDVKVLDLYFKTQWNKLTLEIEAPLISGTLGHVYNATTSSSYDAKAILVETNYQWNEALNIGLKVGHVTGDNAADVGSFSAMYLNPNFKIGNILFGYNPMAVGDITQSYFDAYVTNVQYVALHSEYMSGKWNWQGSVLYAKALEVATTGQQSFNHLKNKVFTASADQKDDLGIEFDFNSTYSWNSEITLNINMGYLLTGDYFGFSDTAVENTTANVMLLQFGLGVEF